MLKNIQIGLWLILLVIALGVLIRIIFVLSFVGIILIIAWLVGVIGYTVYKENLNKEEESF